MKLQEINEAPVNEEGIIGRGVAAAQQLGSKLIGSELSRMSVTDRHAMNIFIKNFLDKVSVALGVAIKSNIVDPKIVDTSGVGGGGVIRPTGAPVSPLGQQTRQQMLAQRAANAAPGTGRTPTAPGQPTAPTAPTAAPATPTVPPAPVAPATPLTDFGSVGAERAKRAQAGAAIPDSSRNLGRNEPVLGDTPPDWIRRSSWAPSRQTESTKHSGDVKSRVSPKTGSLSEAQYQKLNSIFESILLSEAKSIPAFIKDFLHTNVPQLNTNDPDVAKSLNQLVTQVQTDWTKDKGKSALTKLGQAAYLLAKMPNFSGTAGTTGAQSAGGQGAQGAQGGGTQGSGAQGGNQSAPDIASYTQNILTQINRMQRNDADDLDAIIMNSLRRLYKINNTAYMDTVKHLRTMIQTSAPATPSPAQGSPAQAAPNLVVARESKNRVKR
jgi:hypothetical protein